MIAAIGTDGTRDVVWGLGETEEAARADASTWLAGACGAPVELRFAAVSSETAARVEMGVVGVAELGL